MVKHNIDVEKNAQLLSRWPGIPSSNLTVTQVSNPPLPALHCLHEGSLEGKSAIYMLIQCTPLLVEKVDVAPDMTLRFTVYKEG